MTEFFQMGGYAMYVWPAYAITAAALIITVISPLRRRLRMLRELSAIAAQRDIHRSE
ncbi:MAG: heme exporter protein CcmD [Acidiferrobacteraceae bacterium]|jgi:heme exporter protein D|nr:heme exporter protein CcmD [Acidiferrobacteraceae bacterium]MDP6791838.1 heme exporter protein CcmD [Arenicellales bacterium]MDP6918290.1 heme exporter protein CcmD [Arenicellales bacterium]|tara:strand:+ start:11997 stop:12167 length:171 start_codon:yes stop_codon:yes gene_type:complete